MPAVKFSIVGTRPNACKAKKVTTEPAPDGKPRTILITAAHVLEKMPSVTARIGYRVQSADRVWRYDPEALQIRNGDHPLWVKHPTRDIAAMVVEAPQEFVRAAIPLNYLAKDDTFSDFNLGPGDEMMALGFPRGLSANPAGDLFRNPVAQ